MKFVQKLTHSVLSELSFRQQEKLRNEWNQKLEEDPFPFVPHEFKNEVSQEALLAENTKLGNFSSDRLRKMFLASSFLDRIRRMSEKKLVVGVGFGLGFDSQ